MIRVVLLFSSLHISGIWNEEKLTRSKTDVIKDMTRNMTSSMVTQVSIFAVRADIPKTNSFVLQLIDEELVNSKSLSGTEWVMLSISVKSIFVYINICQRSHKILSPSSPSLHLKVRGQGKNWQCHYIWVKSTKFLGIKRH